MKIENIKQAIEVLTKYFSIKDNINAIKETIKNKTSLTFVDNKCKEYKLSYTCLEALVNTLENELDQIEEQIKEL